VKGEVLIAGGGLGGLAAAVAARHAGWEARLFEQAPEFSEVGAGIQLGPNATAILREWGLLDGPLAPPFGRPERLRVRDARTGADLAQLPLDAHFELRYGAPYRTVHRADLQTALREAACSLGARLSTGMRLAAFVQQGEVVRAVLADGRQLEAELLVGADGVWSRVREQLLADGTARPTGHLAYRGLVRQDGLPAAMRSNEVTAWLGRRMHLVSYPVRGDDWLNVVCVVEGRVEGDPRSWDHEAVARDLTAALARECRALRELVEAVPQWRLWVLHDRDPISGPRQMAQGRVALLGDAAHPMRPYLAQGAGMALEDARELQRILGATADCSLELPAALQRYALNRWQRCARVQRRSRRNGAIFHLAGPLRWGRDLSLRLGGARVLDLPWLYRGA
jgi:salicylate hydroxylase